MNDGDDLLGKADALLSRYRSVPAALDTSHLDFPVLTEIVEPAPAAWVPEQVPDGSATKQPLPLQARESLNLQELEIQLRNKVLVALEPYVADRLNELLETRTRLVLASELDRLTAQIATAARDEMLNLLRAAVEETVRREIAHLQPKAKQPSD